MANPLPSHRRAFPMVVAKMSCYKCALDGDNAVPQLHLLRPQIPSRRKDRRPINIGRPICFEPSADAPVVAPVREAATARLSCFGLVIPFVTALLIAFGTVAPGSAFASGDVFPALSIGEDAPRQFDDADGPPSHALLRSNSGTVVSSGRRKPQTRDDGIEPKSARLLPVAWCVESIPRRLATRAPQPSTLRLQRLSRHPRDPPVRAA